MQENSSGSPFDGVVALLGAMDDNATLMHVIDNATSCDHLYALYSEPWIWLAYSLQAILGLGAVIVNILVIVLLFKSDLVPVNLKLILINMGIWCTLGCLYLMLRVDIYFIYHVLGDDCAIQLWRWSCRSQELLFLWCLVQICLSVLAIAFERLVSLCRFTSDTDKMLKDSLVGQMTVGLVWTLTVATCIIACLSIDEQEKSPLVLCTIMLSGDLWRIRILVLTGLGIELVFLLLYSISYCTTRRKYNQQDMMLAESTEAYSLSKRFTQKRNMEVHEMLLPVICNESLLGAVIFGGTALLLFLGLSLHVTHQMLVVEYVVRVVFVLLAALHPFLLLWNSYALRKEAERCCSCLFHGVFPPGPTSDVDMSPREVKTSQPHSAHSSKAETHFDILNTMWSAEPKNDESKNPLLEPAPISPEHQPTDPRLDVSTFQSIDDDPLLHREDLYSSMKKTTKTTTYKIPSNIYEPEQQAVVDSYSTYTKNAQPYNTTSDLISSPVHVIYEDPHEDSPTMVPVPLYPDEDGLDEHAIEYATMTRSIANERDVVVPVSPQYETPDPGLPPAEPSTSYSRTYQYSHSSSTEDRPEYKSYSSQTSAGRPEYTTYPSSIIEGSSHMSTEAPAWKNDYPSYSSHAPPASTFTYSNLDNEESEYIKAIRRKYRTPAAEEEEESKQYSHEIRSKIHEKRASFFSDTGQE